MRSLAVLADWRNGIRFHFAAKGNESQVGERKDYRDDEDGQHELDHVFADFLLGFVHDAGTSGLTSLFHAHHREKWGYPWSLNSNLIVSSNPSSLTSAALCMPVVRGTSGAFSTSTAAL